MTEELKSRAIKGVVWTVIERYSGQIVQFVVTVILARILTPAEYGLVGMLAIFVGLSAIFIDGGFASALIQCKDRTQSDYSTVFYINTAMAGLIYLLLFFTAPLISDFYKEPQLTGIIRIYCISLVISALSSTSKTMLTVELDFKTSTKISLTSGILSGGVGITMACCGCGVWALVGQTLSDAVLTTILSYYFVRWLPTAKFSKESFCRLFSFGSKLFAAQIISSVYENIFGLVIGKKFNAAALGYYSRADTFNKLFNGSVTHVLGRVSYPLLSSIQDQESRLINIYQKYISISAFLTFPMLMLLCGFAKPIILFLFTDKWATAIPLMQVLAFAYIWDGVIISNLNLIKVKGRSDFVLKLEVIKKVIAFMVLGISILFQSVMAICAGRVVYAFIALYLNTYYTKRLMNYGFVKQVRSYWMYLLNALVILAVGLGVSALIDNPFLALCIGVPLCIAIYAFLCCKFRLSAYYEIRDIVIPEVTSALAKMKRKVK